ncbi:TPA: hypothetical protein ACJTOE_004616 [Klebsiella aerogenes]
MNLKYILIALGLVFFVQTIISGLIGGIAKMIFPHSIAIAIFYSTIALINIGIGYYNTKTAVGFKVNTALKLHLFIAAIPLISLITAPVEQVAISIVTLFVTLNIGTAIYYFKGKNLVSA